MAQLPGDGPLRAQDYSGVDIGARVNAAIATLPDGGEITLPAGTFQFSTTIVLSKPVWLVGQGAHATVLEYSGAGPAVEVEAGSAKPYLSGGIRDLALVGQQGSGAVGILQVDTVGFTYSQIAVEDFSGPGGVGIWLDNRPSSACPRCASGDSERTSWDRVSFFENGVGLKLTNSGGTNSFEYSWMWASHFQINNGQTGIWVDGDGDSGSVYLQHSDMDFMANVCLVDASGPNATVVSVTGGAYWGQGFIHISAEQSCGGSRGPAVMWNVDSASAVDGWGAYMPGNLVNNVAPGGSLAIGDTELPVPAIGTGVGKVVLSTGARLDEPVLDGATLAGAVVPPGSILTASGTVDVSGGVLLVPDVIENGRAALELPGQSDTLVGRSTVDTLRNKTLLSPALVSPSVGGETITNPIHATATFFLAGPLDVVWTAAEWTPDHPIEVTRVQATARFGPVGCPQAAHVTLLQQGGGEVTVGIASGSADSGPLSVPMSADKPILVRVSRAAGCTVVTKCSACGVPVPRGPASGRRGPLGPVRRGSREVVRRGQPPSDVELVVQFRGR